MSGIPAGAGSLLGKRLGKYEILALLALGGTAEIYLARIGGAAGFEKYVVVKCLHDHLADDQEFVKMFLDEARLAAHLDHSNIVQTFELGEHENRYYMVMEFLAGLSLAMIVRRAGERLPGGRLPPPLVLNIIAQSAAGLHYAHERSINGKVLNIVHRDISPQNLVVSFEGVAKVVDFGIAKAEMRETRTRSGTIKGKFAYMSPEQCVAQNVDRRTDVFALGVIAHELLTGKRLFKRPSPYDTYQAVIECNVPPPSESARDIDPAIDPIIMRAVAKDKEARYPTAEAFGDALLGYLHHRAKASGPSEVSRFFDVHFTQEIDEHGARMRELISGRELLGEVNWNEEEDERKRQAAAQDTKQQREREDKANETVEGYRGKLGAANIGGGRATGEGTQDLETGDLEDLISGRASSASLDDVIDDIGDDAGDPDDMPADRTRIEANPLELIAELAAKHAPAPAAAKGNAGKPGASKPASTAAQPGPMPSGALPLPEPPPIAPGAVARAPTSGGSAKFPNAANLPTMIAELDESSDVDAEPIDEQEPTSMASSAQVSASGRRPALPNVANTGNMANVANVPSLVGPNGPVGASLAGGMGAGASGPSASEAAMAAVASMSYPVMSRDAAQAARESEGGYGGLGPSVGAGSPIAPPSGPYPGAPGSGPYPGAPGSGPFQPYPSSGPYDADPARAANLMSPVGEHYAGQVDWNAAAAMSAKAIPRWLLAMMFAGGILGALVLTIILARLLHHHH